MRGNVPDWKLLQSLDRSEDYRLLRRLAVREGSTGAGSLVGTRVGVAVDVETTGIGDDDVIIELALRRFRFDGDGIISRIDRGYSWLEDPGRELATDIVRLTGITDADVAGRRIDDEAVIRLLSSAEFVVAHNAGFDRRHVERRLPAAAGLAWASSCTDVDWRGAGFEGRALGWLLSQCGLFHGAHRALDDVDGVIALLAHPLPSGGTVLAEMLGHARAPTWRFRAVGASFGVKDQLRARGYRWDAVAEPKAWRRDVPDAEREAEEWWLAANVYGGATGARALGPEVRRITWHERHA